MTADQTAVSGIMVLGLVQDENGQKMSKSKGNAVDPMEALEKYGADAIRWYFIVNSAPWLPSRFYGKAVQEGQRKFLGTLWNTYAFYVLYADIDSFDATKYQLEYDKLPVMELKMGLTSLTPDQQKRYDSRYVRPSSVVAKSVPRPVPAKSGIDEIEKVLSKTDEDEEPAQSIDSAEAISKMSAAASRTVPDVAAQAANRINTPNVKVDARRTFSETNKEDVQNKLADSIRAVFAGIQKPGMEEAPAAEAPEMPEEDFSDEDIKEYNPSHTEDLSQYKIKKLEPESINTGAVKAARTAGENESEQLTLDEYMPSMMEASLSTTMVQQPVRRLKTENKQPASVFRSRLFSC